MKTPTLSDAAKQVAEWNARNPIGVDVIVRNDRGRLMFTQTRSIAKVYGENVAAVCVLDVPGWLALGRVRAATAKEVIWYGHSKAKSHRAR